MQTQDVLLKPIITEQSMKDVKQGKYTFAVKTSARKPQIKDAIEKTFSVKVISLATRIIKGKTIRTGKRRQEMKLSSVKKATVRVAKDQTISIFQTAGEK